MRPADATLSAKGAPSACADAGSDTPSLGLHAWLLALPRLSQRPHVIERALARAGMIFRKEPFFYGHDNYDQLVKIAKVQHALLMVMHTHKPMLCLAVWSCELPGLHGCSHTLNLLCWRQSGCEAA